MIHLIELNLTMKKVFCKSLYKIMIRSQILNSILTHLATLTRVNGFATDIGLHVTYFQDYPVAYDGPESVTLFDEDGNTDEVGAHHIKKVMLTIDAIAYIQTDPVQESCNLLADIVALIGRNRNWDGLAVGTYLYKDTKVLEEMGKKAVRVRQEFRVDYRVHAFEL